MEISCVTVDCADPARLASFWNEALEWGGVVVADGGDRAICGPTRGGVYLEFVRVPEEKVTKNRLHLGCSVERLEALTGEITRLQHLGASVAWEETFAPELASAYRNIVMRDTEGNEFCLSGGRLPV